LPVERILETIRKLEKIEESPPANHSQQEGVFIKTTFESQVLKEIIRACTTLAMDSSHQNTEATTCYSYWQISIQYKTYNENISLDIVGSLNDAHG
jgi:hypothetical protein